MKTWQTLTLCFSIFTAVLGASFYTKYEPKTLITSNYGPVDLGRVFSEKVMIDVSIMGISGSGDDIKKVVESASYYDKSEPVDSGFLELFDLLNIGVAEKDKIKYEHASPKTDHMKLKIKTYISYSSSNFMNIPYILAIKEETYPLPKNESIKENVAKIIDQNFNSTKDSVIESLFLTDKAQYGLVPKTN